MDKMIELLLADPQAWGIPLAMLVLGSVAGYLLAFYRQQSVLRLVQIEKEHQQQLHEQQQNQLQEQRDHWQAQAEQFQQESANTHSRLVHAEKQLAEQSVRLQAARHEMDEKVSLLQQAREQMTLEFQSVAQRLFDEKTERFNQQSKSSLGELLNPLKEQLGDFKKRVEDVYDKESRDRVSLFNEIVALKDLNNRMTAEAVNLTRALKGDSKIQGNWGEMVLEKVLEISGLQKGREYETQGQYSNDSGQRLRPDVIVHLPDARHVIIDSKVSLTAWERFSTEEDIDKSQYLQAHIESIKNHIRDLGGKNYPDLQGINAPDYVLMFIPVEPAFLKALEAAPDLVAHAFERNIMLVCPSTLLVSLRTISNIWRTEYQNRNALKIAEQAGALHDQFVSFAESLEEVGQRIGKAKDAFDTARNRLIAGKGNLVRRTEQLEALGARTRKKMPAALLNAVEEAESSLALTDLKPEMLIEETPSR